MNLIEHDFKKSPLLSFLPSVESCVYRGSRDPGLMTFQIESEGQSVFLVSSLILQREEAIVWKSFEDLFNRTLQEAAASMRGFFGLELLSLDLGAGIRSFEWDNFRRLLINHSTKMTTGEIRMIPYTSVFCLFKKRIPEEWGKIEFRSPVKIYNQEPEKIDLYLKSIVRHCGVSDQPFWIHVHDLSRDPILKLDQPEVLDRLQSWIKKEKSKPDFPGKIFWIQGGRSCELLNELQGPAHV